MQRYRLRDPCLLTFLCIHADPTRNFRGKWYLAGDAGSGVNGPNPVRIDVCEISETVLILEGVILSAGRSSLNKIEV